MYGMYAVPAQLYGAEMLAEQSGMFARVFGGRALRCGSPSGVAHRAFRCAVRALPHGTVA